MALYLGSNKKDMISGIILDKESDMGNFLVVKIDFETNTASHSVSEIIAAVDAGKIVVTTDIDGMLVPLYYAEMYAYFVAVTEDDDKLHIVKYTILQDKSVIHNVKGVELNNGATPEQIDAAIEEYLTKNPVAGKTPVRGVDYWTDEDKAEIKSYVDEAILGGAW